MRKFLTEYKKVVFNSYGDKDFLQRDHRGELDRHLGIMGPVIKVEVDELLTVSGVQFRKLNQLMCRVW